MTRRVLLLDADPDSRLLLSLMLRPEDGFEVVAATGDAAEAVEATALHRPEVVLVDCSPPHERAFQALEPLRRSAPEAQLVLVSAHSPAELRLASRTAGAVGWLSKEMPARRLVEELATLLGVLGVAERALEEARIRLAGRPASAREARRFLEATLAGREEDEELGEVLALLVSELVTNAVLHAGSDVELLVRLTPDSARIEVGDDSPVRPEVGDRGLGATSGRGLALVESLARRWGSHPRPGGGKVVWFEVDRS